MFQSDYYIDHIKPIYCPEELKRVIFSYMYDDTGKVFFFPEDTVYKDVLNDTFMGEVDKILDFWNSHHSQTTLILLQRTGNPDVILRTVYTDVDELLVVTSISVRLTFGNYYTVYETGAELLITEDGEIHG